MLGRAHDYPLEIEERASEPLAGGIVMNGHQCGQVWGSTLAAGAQAYRRFGPGAKAQTAAIEAAQRITRSFGELCGSIDCATITRTDFTSRWAIPSYFFKNGVRCFRLAAQYAPVAFEEIETALASEPSEVLAPPVSCSAIVAERLKASSLRTTMASGGDLAGGDRPQRPRMRCARSGGLADRSGGP